MGEPLTKEYLQMLHRLFASVLAMEGNEQICTLHDRPYTPLEVLEIVNFIGEFRPDELNVADELGFTFTMGRD